MNRILNHMIKVVDRRAFLFYMERVAPSWVLLCWRHVTSYANYQVGSSFNINCWIISAIERFGKSRVLRLYAVTNSVNVLPTYNAFRPDQGALQSTV